MKNDLVKSAIEFLNCNSDPSKFYKSLYIEFGPIVNDCRPSRIYKKLGIENQEVDLCKDCVDCYESLARTIIKLYGGVKYV